MIKLFCVVTVVALAAGLSGCVVAPPYAYAPAPAYGYGYAPGYYYGAPVVDVGVGQVGEGRNVGNRHRVLSVGLVCRVPSVLCLIGASFIARQGIPRYHRCGCFLPVSRSRERQIDGHGLGERRNW